MDDTKCILCDSKLSDSSKVFYMMRKPFVLEILDRADRLAERLLTHVKHSERKHAEAPPCVCRDNDPCCLKADIDRDRAALAAYEAKASKKEIS